MSKAYEGFYTIFENGSWGGGTPYNPQALPIESESLGVHQDIRFRDNLVASGRVHNPESLVVLDKAPSGAISYSFRADDCLKVFFSHFQAGSQGSTGAGTYLYSFFPSAGNPNFVSGTFGNGVYGGTGYVYSVSLLKRLTQSGTNAQLYKNGICDKLAISWAADAEAKLSAEFKFRSVDPGTAVVETPNNLGVGAYSSEPNLHSLYGTVLFNGANLGVEQANLLFKNNLESSKKLGARNSDYFKFGRYEVSGELGFDLPQDGLKYVGSMIGTNHFSLSLVMLATGTSKVVFDLPNCVLSPFENNLEQGEYFARLPFRAFGINGQPPVTVSVYSSYSLTSGLKFFDALLGTRTLSEFRQFDAGTGARVLSGYTQYDRDF